MTKNKRFLSIISVAVLVALIFSLGTVSVSAQENTRFFDMNDPDNYDFRGNFIPNMMEDFALEGVADMRYQLCGIVGFSSIRYCVFVDSRLEYYGFIDELVSNLTNYGSTTEEKLAYLGENEHHIFVHRYGYLYEDIAESEALGQIALYNFDPYDENSSFAGLGEFLGTHYMCGFGIWNLLDEYYHLLDILQTSWITYFDVVMPVYVIERDEIQWGDGLILKILRAYPAYDMDYYLSDN